MLIMNIVLTHLLILATVFAAVVVALTLRLWWGDKRTTRRRPDPAPNGSGSANRHLQVWVQRAGPTPFFATHSCFDR